MSTKAQNEVYEKYGLRKGEVWQALCCVRDDLSWTVSRACGNILTGPDLAPTYMALASLVHLSGVWQAYQECDREG